MCGLQFSGQGSKLGEPGDAQSPAPNYLEVAMANITHKGNPIHTVGNPPAAGQTLPDFRLVAQDLSQKSLADFSGKKLVLNIFPSIDTGVCATSVRKFNKEAAGLAGTEVLGISEDLPFAQGRFCGAEGITGVTTLSTVRDRDFGKRYGITIADGLLEGLLSRVVIVADSSQRVVYVEQVPEIGQEPDYEKALAAVRSAS